MILQEGIILKTSKYQENSKIVYILTENGLITALIRASCNYKSKNFAYSQELTKIEFALSKSKRNSFDTVTSGKVIETYSQLKKEYQDLFETAKILYLTYQINEHVVDYKKLYNLLSFVFSYANNNLKHLKLLYIIYRLKLLYLLGVGPNLNKCVFCKENEGTIFSVTSGGVVCKKCLHLIDSNSVVISDNKTIQTIKILYFVKIDKITDELLVEIYNLEEIDAIILNIENFLKVYYNLYLSISSI